MSPINQNTMPCIRSAGLTVNNNPITAPQPAASTTPVSRVRIAVHSPPTLDRKNTKMIETSAPVKAIKFTAITDKPRRMAVNANTAAPPETPRIYGSARGFLSNTCIRQPANASIPPT